MTVAEADLVREGMEIANVVAKRVARRLGRLASFDDFRGIARVALIEAARSYDPSRSAFAVYAALKLKWAIFDEVRRETHGRTALARLHAVMASERLSDAPDAEPGDLDEPASQEEWQARLDGALDGQAAALAIGLLGGSGDVMNVADGAATPEEQTGRTELFVNMRRAVTMLPGPQRQIVERHYFGGEPFDEIAKTLVLSKSWVSRLHTRALEALGKAMHED